MKTIIIRVILSLVLLYFVYGETGGVTAFAIFLIIINSEVQEIINKNIIKRIK